MVQDKHSTILNDASRKTHRLSQDVFLTVQNEIAQILDFNRGQFYGLDTIATQMVLLVLESGVEDAIAHITQTYDTTESLVRTDINNLLQELERKHLLVTIAKKNARSFQLLQWWMIGTGKLSAANLQLLKVVSLIFRNLLNREQAPNRHTVKLLLALSWLSFRLLGWSGTISLWQHWHLQSGVVTEVSAQGQIIQAVDRIVREAATGMLFLPMVCKERALVSYHLLRAFYTLPAILVIGIDRHPFQVHAWVECDGLVISDAPAHCELFTPVIRYF